MIKPKLWKGESLKGKWQVTLKLDGVRVLVKDGKATSRSGKPLYNVPRDLPDGDYECFLGGSWEATISALRTKMLVCGGIPASFFYSLDPVCKALYRGTITDPEADSIKDIMSYAVADGYEGLVLRQEDRWLKVKPSETYDVPVTAIQIGTGKYDGMLGALITPMGKVGTGFSDSQRQELNDIPLGTIIEVRCMQLTPSGKFRHPSFVRVREDKTPRD